MTSLEIPEPELTELLQVFPRGVIALDLETTGLSPLFDKIIELSAVKITPRGIETFDQLIDPKIPIPQEAMAIHGINDLDLKGQPSLLEILPRFLSFVDELPLIAHNAKFDLGFLLLALHHSPHPLPNNAVYCTVKFSRQVFHNQKSHKLGDLSHSLGIQLENHHRALDDAWACLKLFTLGLLKVKKDNPKQPSILRESLLFHCSDFHQNAFEEIPNKLKPLIKKTRSQAVVDILYKGGSHRSLFRPIRPVSFLPMPEGHILYALCLLSNHYKFFALKKISEIKELNAQEIQERLKTARQIK